MNFNMEKFTKILFAVFIMFFSIIVLARKIPETEYVKKTVEHLEESQDTILAFSGTTLATSLAMSALPDDFASPLANTVSDLNTYFIFMSIVIFVEKLVVIEGTKIALVLVIPAACGLYILFVLSAHERLKKFASKLLILGLSLVVVIPFSTQFTEAVCKDYMVYVEETIAEADAGAAKINEVMSSSNEETSFFEKLSEAFKTAIQGMSDLLTYFRNVIKKCTTAVAIMLVNTFVLPMLMLMLFRWLLNELFSLHIPIPHFSFRLPHGMQKDVDKDDDLLSLEDHE